MEPIQVKIVDDALTLLLQILPIALSPLVAIVGVWFGTHLEKNKNKKRIKMSAVVKLRNIQASFSRMISLLLHPVPWL